MVSIGIEFVREPKQAEYGMVAVFKDLYGNLGICYSSIKITLSQKGLKNSNFYHLLKNFLMFSI